jgi:hypothetical protein
VECPFLPCASAGNLANLNPQGGTFFLGVVAAPGFEFTKVTLQADIPRDESGEPNGIVPNGKSMRLLFRPSPNLPLGSCLRPALAMRLPSGADHGKLQ